MYYMSFVRNINDNIEKATLETLRKHLAKSGIEYASFSVREISKITLRLHAHMLLLFEDYDQYVAMQKYIEMHHYKAYVDKCQEVISRDRAIRLALYMTKDLKPESKLYVDYNKKDTKRIDICDLHPKIYNIFNPPKKHIVEDDPFIDSEEEIINLQLK